ncbi:MAG: molybdate ABC transporter permease subunit [Desulfovibrionaceae bacterium]|nr:molybdate ABC transporter permease subunit [Desulfovibrionaceae bacterium]MBF0512830.1 molybdate ABC transporter permease subunit [Desulfovibrionaceae bacterium]
MGPVFASALAITLKVAVTATLCSFVLGVGLAGLVSRRPFPGRGLLDAVCAMPLVLPPTVLGYYLLVAVGRRGVFGAWLLATFGVSLTFTWQGAALASALVGFPLVFTSARAAFAGVDANMQNAARTLGAGELAVFFRISLPLAWRGVAAGTLLAFARAMGEFGATLMIAGNLPGKTQTLSLAIYEAVQAGRDGDAAALVLLTTAVSLAVLLGAGKLAAKKY